MRIHRAAPPVSFLLIFAFLGGPGIAGAQETAAAPRFPHLVVIDLRDVLGAPVSWRAPQWERFSLGVAGVGAAALLDREVRDAERRDHSQTADGVADAFEPLGSYGAFGVLGTYYLVGLVRDDEGARSVAEDGLVASAIAGGIITPILKSAVGRR